jgi:methylmalonyl-CoA mutase cobalamin-binding domain/chain
VVVLTTQNKSFVLKSISILSKEVEDVINVFEEIIMQDIIDVDIENIGRHVQDALGSHADPLEILGSLSRGMEEVGKNFERGEYFITDLIMAGETMKTALEVLKPHLLETKGRTSSKGKIALGTIIGDLHDIGKNIIKNLLEASSFTVYDLGIDVPPRAYAEKAKEVGANMVGISALLSTTQPMSKDVVDELKKIGIRDKVKVIVGGAAARDWMIREYGVDATTTNAMEGLAKIRSWAKEW